MVAHTLQWLSWVKIAPIIADYNASEAQTRLFNGMKHLCYIKPTHFLSFWNYSFTVASVIRMYVKVPEVLHEVWLHFSIRLISLIWFGLFDIYSSLCWWGYTHIHWCNLLCCKDCQHCLRTFQRLSFSSSSLNFSNKGFQRKNTTERISVQ